jgi:hypothetical protein
MSQDVPGHETAYIEEEKKRRTLKKDRRRKVRDMPSDWKPVVGPNDKAEFERFQNYVKATARPTRTGMQRGETGPPPVSEDRWTTDKQNRKGAKFIARN